MGRPIYGHVMEGYWQDIGNLDQYRQANFDALDESVRLNIEGVRLRGNVWIGEGADIHDVEEIEGPAFIGNHCRITRDASIGPYTVLSNGVTLRERARTTRSVIDASTHVGRSALIEGAILGRACDIRDHVRIQEGAAIGDEVTIGSESNIAPHVRIYPYKEVETGSQVYENLIWETRASSRLFGKDGVSGLVNVDLTPETAARLATALGTALKRGARVVASRDSAPGCRMIKRAMISGLNASGVDVADLRVSPPARQPARLEDAGLRRRRPRRLEPSRPRGGLHPHLRAARDPAHARACRRRSRRTSRARSSGASPRAASARCRTRPGSARATRRICSTRSTRRRSASAGSGSSSTTATRRPRSCCRSSSGRSASRRSRRTGSSRSELGDRETLAQAIGHTKRLVTAIGADLGAVFDQSGERLYLVDDQGHEVPVDQTLLLYVRLLADRGVKGKAAFPVTVTSKVEELAGDGLEIVRTPNSLSRPDAGRRRRRGSSSRARSAAATSSRSSCPPTTPSRASRSCSSCWRRREAAVGARRGAAGPTLIHRRLACPWAKKGVVMRVLNERLAGRDLDLTDGIKLIDARGWSQVLPDPDEPLVHLYAEGETTEASEELEREVRELVEEIMQGDADSTRTSVEASS